MSVVGLGITRSVGNSQLEEHPNTDHARLYTMWRWRGKKNCRRLYSSWWKWKRRFTARSESPKKRKRSVSIAWQHMREMEKKEVLSYIQCPPFRFLSFFHWGMKNIFQHTTLERWNHGAMKNWDSMKAVKMCDYFISRKAQLDINWDGSWERLEYLLIGRIMVYSFYFCPQING